MARSIRIEFGGAYYHVMARGNRKEAIYLDEEDRKFFLKTLGEACGKMGWRVHGWVLMGNHYHLMIETPEANLVKGMQWLQNTYTRRFNTRHGLWGRVFGDRYKSVIVQGEGYYYETLLDYLHLNPVRAGLIDVRKGQSVMDYPWSSVGGGHRLPPARRPAWLDSERVLAAFGFSDTAAGRQGFVERLDQRAREEELERCGSPEVPEGWDARFSHLRRGWYWGSQEFSQHLQKLAAERLNKKGHRTYQGALASKDHGEREAHRLRAEGLESAELKEADLAQLPGSDPRKVAVARVVWERTSVNLNWIAENFHMRSPANASQQIRRQREKMPPLPHALAKWVSQSRFVA